MDRSTVVLLTLIVYKIVLVGIGIVASRLNRDEEDFFLGGKKLGPLVSAISASASSSSSWTLLSVSGMAYLYGLSALWLYPACLGGFALNWFVVAPALRRYLERRQAITMVDVLVQGAGPAGPVLARFATLIIVCLFTVYVASQFQGAGKAFAANFELDVHEATLIGAAIVVFYTLLGGFWAVSLTDTIQGLLMVLAALLLPTVALLAVGPGEFLARLAAVPDPHYLDFSHGRGPIASVGFVLGLFGIGLAYPGQPHVVTRFMALEKGRKRLFQAQVIAMTWALLIYSGMLLLGLCGRVLLPDLPDGESVLLAVAREHLPPVAGGIVLAAVLSAIMSTADSQLLVVASSLIHDLRRGERAEGNVVLRSRVVIVLTGIAAAALAGLSDESIFRRVLFAFSAMGAAFGPLLLANVLRGPVGPRRSLLAMGVGLGGVVLVDLVLPVAPEHRSFCEYFLPFVAAAAIAFSAPRRAADQGFGA
ncbi:MAG: sodium/proline symporter [Planctomycetes bacterium]|nr:sodium/proline symporter [Planctomycetota bacterium]